MNKTDLLQLKIDVMQFMLSFLTKQNALRIENTTNFRKPTRWEERKHQKLIAKQRRKYNGE
jgi:hypothetical protein